MELTLTIDGWKKHFQIENYVIVSEMNWNPSKKPDPSMKITFSTFQIGRFSPMNFTDIKNKFEWCKTNSEETVQ